MRQLNDRFEVRWVNERSRLLSVHFAFHIVVFLAAAAAVFPRFRRAPAAAARSGSGSEGRGLSGGTTGTPSARRTGTDNSSESGKRRGPFFGGGRKRRVSDTPIEPDCSCDRATDRDRDRERCRNLFGKPRPFPPRPGSGGRGRPRSTFSQQLIITMKRLTLFDYATCTVLSYD